MESQQGEARLTWKSTKEERECKKDYLPANQKKYEEDYLLTNQILLFNEELLAIWRRPAVFGKLIEDREVLLYSRLPSGRMSSTTKIFQSVLLYFLLSTSAGIAMPRMRMLAILFEITSRSGMAHGAPPHKNQKHSFIS